MKLVLSLFAFTTAAIAQPAITAVLDAGALTNNIAQGSEFIVKGTGLSAAGFTQAIAPQYPTSLSNVSISMAPVAGGAAVTPLMVYDYNQNGVNQLAAILPSTAAIGAYDLKVTNGAATSAAFRTTVVARKPAIFTASGDGAGQAQATLDGGLILDRPTNQGKLGIFDTRSAHPGERVDLWGTGLGADIASDTGGSSGDQTTAGQIRVIVNGVEVTPFYAGRAVTYPGLDQIAFNLPASPALALNCAVDIQLRAGAVYSNGVTIATSSGDACPTTPGFRINEVESNGGTPGDWVELYNPTAAPISLSGYTFKDNDDTHNYALPNVTIPAGGYYMLEEADFGFGLGAPDATRVFRLDGTLALSYNWSTHAATTYGRCPNGAGPLVTTTASTKAGANSCLSPVKINEVESDAGVPGDWVEIFNPSATTADISGFTFKDNDDTHAYLIPQGTTIPAGGYLVLDEAQFNFGLGSGDSARIFDTTGVLIDSYTWTAHATTTFGRCPDGTGAFVTTTASTKGTANACPADLTYATWPGGAAVQTVDVAGAFTSNLSGLIYEGSGTTAPGVLWGIQNGPSTLYRMIFNGTNWVSDTANNWSAGKALHYPDGTGDPDSEGVTFTTGSAAGIYVSTERNNSANTVSRLSVLRIDATAAGAVLTATHEWNLTADLPASGPNLGLEAITWIPDSYLTSKGFFDESKNRAYNPADYANHGSGIFFVGLESNGMVYAYALDHTNTKNFTRVATLATGLASVMDLQYDRDTNDLWGVCDDTCQGRSVVFRIDSTTGKFTVARRFERPGGMPNINNEGFAIAPAALCSSGFRPVFWADDSSDDGHSIRSGTLTCSIF